MSSSSEMRAQLHDFIFPIFGDVSNGVLGTE